MNLLDPTTLPGIQEQQHRILEKTALGAPIDETLVDICRLVESLVPQASCSVMRFDPVEGTLRFVAAPRIPEAQLAAFPPTAPGTGVGSCAAAVFERRPVFVEDTLTDPRWEKARSSAVDLGIRACWSVPIFSSQDEVLGTFAISRPIPGTPTEDHRRLLETASNLAGIGLEREKALRDRNEQRALLESILASAKDPIFAKDQAGRYLLANEAELEGVVGDVTEILGKTDADLYPAHIAERMREADRRVIESGESCLVEETFDNPVHGRRTFVIRKTPLRGEDGRPRGIVGVARDVTQFRQAEAAMRQAQKLESLGVLTGGIAHDFNNLLTGILGNAELALRETEEGTREHQSLLEIRRAAGVAADLTNQMLAYAGRTEVSREEVSLPRLVREVAQLISSSISKKAALTFDVPEDVSPVHADPPQLRQVTMNLLTNASDALEGRVGEITLRMREVDRAEIPRDALAGSLQAERYVSMSVTDSGAGMDEATLSRIFDPFFTTKMMGRGLGLAAVQGIVTGHDGAIAVHSLVGRGTTFTVYLPASAGRVAARTDASAHPRARSATVLLADDEPTVSSLVRRILEQEGHRVLVADDGRQALDLLRRHGDEIELLLLDWTMPGLSGEEALRRAREEGYTQPAILSSGFAESDLPADFRHSGVTFLKKPWDMGGLLRTVAAALEG